MKGYLQIRVLLKESQCDCLYSSSCKICTFLSANQLAQKQVCWHPTTLDIRISSWVVLLFLTVRLKVISTFWSVRCLQFVYCCWVFILVLFYHLVSWIEKFLNAIIVTLKIHVLLVVENYLRAKFAPPFYNLISVERT